MLTYRQAELLDFIRSYQEANANVSPSFGEMQEALGLASKSGIHRMLLLLEQRGVIRRHYNAARAIQIVTDGGDPAVAYDRGYEAGLRAGLRAGRGQDQ